MLSVKDCALCYRNYRLSRLAVLSSLKWIFVRWLEMVVALFRVLSYFERNKNFSYLKTKCSAKYMNVRRMEKFTRSQNKK